MSFYFRYFTIIATLSKYFKLASFLTYIIYFFILSILLLYLHLVNTFFILYNIITLIIYNNKIEFKITNRVSTIKTLF